MKRFFVMRRIHFLIFGWLGFFAGAQAQPPDPPVSPVEAVSMLGKGILFEPQAGDVDLSISAPYKPEYGTIIKNTGFKSVRIRYQGSTNPMMIAIADGPPYDSADDSLVTELETIVDDLLGKDLAVVITFYGLTEDNPGDLDKMVSWWGYVANRFKNKSHRLIFDLFVEPYKLIKNADHHRIMDYYDAITTEIRKTNPDRLIIYYAIPPENSDDNPYGPGTEWFMTDAYNPVPQDAGIYYLWDFHVLKHNVRDNIRKVEQAWEYMDSAKQAVWSGAWYSDPDNKIMPWLMNPMAININRRFIDRGVCYAYLMMFDGHTGIFDAQNDHNGNGILDEWSYPGLEKILVAGPDIWWNLLSNPGFEKGLDGWTATGGEYSLKLSQENYFLDFQASNTPFTLKQDVTLSLKNNGPGVYHALGYMTSTGNTQVKFILNGTAGGSAFMGESSPVTVTAGEGQLLNEPVNVSWSGELEHAELILEISGDAGTVDKTGLTQFFYDNPHLDITLWPGEKTNQDNYTTRSTSGIDISISLRNLMKQEIADNNEDMIAIADKIHDITRQLEDRLISLIGSDYQYTSEDTQYRTGGYYQGMENAAYKKEVDKYINGKDSVSYRLNQDLIEQQNQAVEYLILYNQDFRELYYDVYRGYPPGVLEETGIDTSVTVNGSTLVSNQPGVAYRWCDCLNLYNPVGGATRQSFSPACAGSYAVEIQVNGFVFTSGCHEITTVGIRNKSVDARTKVYPNPVESYIILDTKNEEPPLQVNLLDIQGRFITSYNHLTLPLTTMVINAQKGIYLLEVIYRDRKETFKIIKY